MELNKNNYSKIDKTLETINNKNPNSEDNQSYSNLNSNEQESDSKPPTFKKADILNSNNATTKNEQESSDVRNTNFKENEPEDNIVISQDPKTENKLSELKIKDIKSECTGDGKNYQMLFKIILIGDSGVGKTSIIHRYVNNKFSDKYLCTIGVDFMMKTLEIDDVIIKLQIWDTAGMERYRQITTSYYRGANAAIVTFDLSNLKSFHNLKYWVNLYFENCNQVTSKCVIILGNKADLVSKREVSQDLVDEFLKSSSSFSYYEVSAFSGESVEAVFHTIAERLYTEVKNNGLTDIMDRRNTGSYQSILSSDFHNLLKQKKKCSC